MNDEQMTRAEGFWWVRLRNWTEEERRWEVAEWADGGLLLCGEDEPCPLDGVEWGPYLGKEPAIQAPVAVDRLDDRKVEYDGRYVTRPNGRELWLATAAEYEAWKEGRDVGRYEAEVDEPRNMGHALAAAPQWTDRDLDLVRTAANALGEDGYPGNKRRLLAIARRMTEGGATSTPPEEPERSTLEHVGMTLMLRDLLGVSADAIRATAVSRAKAYLGNEAAHETRRVEPEDRSEPPPGYGVMRFGGEPNAKTWELDIRATDGDCISDIQYETKRAAVRQAWAHRDAVLASAAVASARHLLGQSNTG